MKVTVVIPCFNQWQYLSESIGSVLAQTYSDCEIVVVDDGSTETPSAEAKAVISNPRVKLLRIENSGPSAARNHGIENANSELILPLDADDKIEPQCVEKMVAVFTTNKDAGIAYCEVGLFGEETGKWEIPKHSFPACLIDNCIVSASMFKKADWKKCGGYNTNMRHGWEDFDFWLSLIENGAHPVSIPEVLFHYRRGHASRSAAFDRQKKVEMYDCLVKNHRQLYAQNVDFIVHKMAEMKAILDTPTTEMELRNDLLIANERIAQMEASGFWKLRNRWQKIKRTLKGG